MHARGGNLHEVVQEVLLTVLVARLAHIFFREHVVVAVLLVPPQLLVFCRLLLL